MGRSSQFFGALALASGALVGLGAVPAGAVPITACGQTVTDDAVLATDLICPSGAGIVVGADGITVDLAGHTVAGSISGDGVSISDFDGVTVLNGHVSGFATGVRVFQSSNATVRELDITLAPGPLTSGVVLGEAESSTVLLTDMHGGGIGILVDGGSANALQDNTFDATQQAVFISAAAGTTVTANHATETAAGVVIGTGSTGTLVAGNVFTSGVSAIYVDPFGNTGTVIRNNTASDFASDGIFIDAGTSITTVEGNRVERNQTGITVRTATTTLTANQAFDNAALGIDAIAGVTDGGGNQAAGNGDPRQCVNVVCTKPFAPITPVQALSPAAILVTPRFTG